MFAVIAVLILLAYAAIALSVWLTLLFRTNYRLILYELTALQVLLLPVCVCM